LLGASGSSCKEVKFSVEDADHSHEFCHNICLQNMYVMEAHWWLVNHRGRSSVIKSVICVGVNKLFKVCNGVKEFGIILVSFGV